MADDNHSRYRPGDPHARGAAPAAPAADPLAELARLIGQNDAFSDHGRTPAQPGAAPRYASPAPPYAHEPAPYGNDPAPPYGHDTPQHYAGDTEPQYGHEPLPRYNAEPRFDDAPRYADDRVPHHDWHNGGLPPADRYDEPMPLPFQQHAPAGRSYDNASYGQPNYPPQDHQGYAPPAYGDPLATARDSYRPDHPDFEGDQENVQENAHEGQDYVPPLYPNEPGAGAMPPPHDDEFYDDAPRGRGRSFLTVVAVLALAVIGTAGAFGYRSLFGSSGVPAVPPVIRASGEPSKVAPPPVPDQSVNKLTYDRFGDAGKDEQLVRRDEKPVDLSKLTPAPTANTPVAPTRPQAGGANPPSAIGDPRRVRTVPIRPNQGDAAAAAVPSLPAAPQAVTPPQGSTSVASVSAPPQPAESAPQPAPRAASPKPAAQSAPQPAQPPAPRPARATHTPAAPNAPLSLSPDANNALPPPAAAQENAPPPRPSAPTRVASAPAASTGGGGGSYLVQVASQKSEADAESALRGIASKYSSVIGGKPHTVRRADLGSKGVYYRAMFGPFASREDAVSLCTSLKQAGGDCVVQH